MFAIVLFFSTSFLLSLLLVVSKSLHSKISADSITGEQKFHVGVVPRIGGLSIYTSFLVGWLLLGLPDQMQVLIIASLPVFLVGFCEDLFKSVSSSIRLFAAFTSGTTFVLLSGSHFTSVDIFLFDKLLNYFSLWAILTVVALAALTNSVNIIDGFNGLASGTGIITSLSLAVLALQTGEEELVNICLYFMSVLFGFFVINFPKGFLFMGDAGAYFIGLFLGGLSIYVIEYSENITPLSLLVVFAYPIVELLFSALRKALRKGHSPFRPDKVHLHMLVFRSFSKRIIKVPIIQNSITGALMLVFPTSGLLFLVLAPVTRATCLLYFLIFLVAYLCLYKKLSLN